MLKGGDVSRETQLWYWFLFGETLSTQRAKELLTKWIEDEQTLEETLRSFPNAPQAETLRPEERRRLRPPDNLPAISAVRWNEDVYPTGLHRLPMKLRPALLFTRGSAALLQRPIVYFPPAEIPEEAQLPVREALSLLLGESLLPAAVHDSPQAALLIGEMAAAEGEALLFVRAGLPQVTPTERETRLIEQERLLLVSPLPPETPANPRWDSVLAQVEASSATHCILTGASPTPLSIPDQTPPTAWLTEETVAGEASVSVERVSPADLLMWLTGAQASKDDEKTETAQPTLSEAARPLGANGPTEPPPTPEETLDILKQGGDVPAVLRNRLLGDQKD
jgi:hypothetical protein